jgi:hypothetical protein
VLTILNTGLEVLTGIGVSIDGPDAAQFAIVTAPSTA